MSKLPDDISTVNLGNLAAVPPEDLSSEINVEALKTLNSPQADRILKYSRANNANTYDDIAYRLVSAMPRIGQVKLQTFNTVAKEREKDEKLLADADFESLNLQEDYLEHRPLENFTDGRLRYQLTQSFIKLWNTDDPDTQDIPWLFSLSNPPDFLLKGSVAQDAPPLITQEFGVNMEEVFWLPFSSLIQTGKFERMQDDRSNLINNTSPGNFYCFVSHRWLTPTEPDPDGLQARLLAWQLLGYLTEAIQVAHQRGLRVPKKFNKDLNIDIGMAGSKLSETLIVNVLRHQLNEELLQKAAEEIESLPIIEDNYGLEYAVKDTGLNQLKTLINERPILKLLCEKILIWYDYNCMPQRPFKEDDEKVFRRNLELLNALQHIGLTLILLDDPSEYLTRAWCTLEAVYADNETMPNWLTLVGASRPSVRSGKTEHYFNELLSDRPHILWRAILDTELHALNEPKDCMKKLGLAATQEEDLPFIYQKLAEMKMPVKIHLDDTEVITGIFPIPFSEEQQSHLIASYSGRQISFNESENINDIKSLDWTSILQIANSVSPFKSRFSSFEKAFHEFDLPGNYTPEQETHLCVIASCESEALLIANWVAQNLKELMDTLRLGIRSISWMSSDVAPVGKIVFGKLEPKLIKYQNFILVGTQMRLRMGKAINLLNNSIKQAKKNIIHFNLDMPSNNIVQYRNTNEEQTDGFKLVGEENLTSHNGGLFRWALEGQLTK